MPAPTVHTRAAGFDRKIPGYEFRRLKQFADEEVWKNFEQEAE